MQFYNVEGISNNTNWNEETDSVRVRREKSREICMKTFDFNETLKNKACFFVCSADSPVKIGIISNYNTVSDKQLSSYVQAFLTAIGMEVKYFLMEEITFGEIRKMLSNADSSGFIRDDEDILDQFELGLLDNRRFGNMDFGENIIQNSSKEDVYSCVEQYLAKDTFIPELDRIYAGGKKVKSLGHPVHYMIETDDRETRKGMYRLLLQALYANGRIHSKRYVFLDIRPDEEISMANYECIYKSCAGGTIVVRYLADAGDDGNYANSGRDIIEKLCEMMKKYCNQVLTVFCLPRECTDAKDIFFENLGNTSFIEIKEEFVSGERAENCLKTMAMEKGIKADKNLYSKLEENKGYLIPDLRILFDEWYNSKLKTNIYPQYKDINTARHEAVKKPAKGSAYDELMEMTGLSEAKNVILQALNYNKAQKIFADKGMICDRPSMHMVFTGNPGTAKTTVARLFAEIMRENGLLSKGKLIEVGRGDLVGKFVGWTAPTIQRKFREAEGSVLFIDEAYSLVDDRDGSFGDEAINTIVQEMENHRNDVVVIFAGYPDKMEGFLQKNPGLRSRIAFHVPFEDYSTKDLCKIACHIAKQKGLRLTKDAGDKLEKLFDKVRTESDFGNGRYVRNVIEKAKMAQATRLLSMDVDSINKDDIATICADDIEIPKSLDKQKVRHLGFE